MIFSLDAGKATQFLVSLFLPLCDEVFVSPLLPQAILVQLSGDLLLFVVEIVDVSGPLMMELEDVPTRFYFSFTLMRLIFSVSHHVVHFHESRFN